MQDICSKISVLNRLVFAVVLSILMLSACKGSGEEPVEEKPIKTKEEIFCEDDCFFANDGECDDGAAGSKSGFCGFGKDCTDCGERIVVEVID